MKKQVISSMFMMIFSLAAQAHIWTCENAPEIHLAAHALKKEALSFRASADHADASFGLSLHALRLASAAHELAEEAGEGHSCLRLRMEFRDVRRAFEKVSGIMVTEYGSGLGGVGLLSSSYLGLESSYRCLEAEVDRE